MYGRIVKYNMFFCVFFIIFFMFYSVSLKHAAGISVREGKYASGPGDIISRHVVVAVGYYNYSGRTSARFGGIYFFFFYPLFSHFFTFYITVRVTTVSRYRPVCFNNRTVRLTVRWLAVMEKGILRPTRATRRYTYVHVWGTCSRRVERRVFTPWKSKWKIAL